MRKVHIIVAACIAVASLPSPLLVRQSFSGGRGEGGVRGDGRISLFNYHEGEYLDVVYREGARYIPQALKKIAHLLKSRGDGTEHAIDVRLIELIAHIQDHFGAETVEVISGYRSPSYNKSLALEGHGVASESLHTRGMAADIHLDEVHEEEVFDYVKKLGLGGVGLYPRFAFVHVDVGPPRTWMEAQALVREPVGTENNPNPAWAALTDKDVYTRGETIKVAITNMGYRRQRLVKNVWTERFRRGEWTNEAKLGEMGEAHLSQGKSSECRFLIPEDFPFGKYRLVIFTTKDFSVPPAYSNEFYVKH